MNTVGATTYEQIKHDIIFGELEPGKKLKLGEMKAQYDASVSTLRETLNRLAGDGLVSAEEQRGFFVKSISKNDLIEIANLRILLENNALKASIANGDTEWEANLVAAYHKLQLMEHRMQTGDQSEKELWKKYDSEFHQAMIQACNSENLLYVHSIIYDKYLRYQMSVLTYRGDQAAAEHRSMFEATLARDVDKALELLTTHIERGLAHSLKRFD